MNALHGTPLATIVSASNAMPFTMRLVRKGTAYGRNLCLIHDKDEPVVEFYDARFHFTGERGAEYGQFVSRYYVRTILSGTGGLCLDGGVKAWNIDAEAMQIARALLANWER